MTRVFGIVLQQHVFAGPRRPVPGPTLACLVGVVVTEQGRMIAGGLVEARNVSAEEHELEEQRARVQLEGVLAAQALHKLEREKVLSGPWSYELVNAAEPHAVEALQRFFRRQDRQA